MALKRSFLKGMGLTEEQVDSIIEAHTETVNGLQEKLSELGDKAGKYEAAQQELDKLKGDGGDWQKKLEELQKEFDSYKSSTEAENLRRSKLELLGGMLTDAGIARESARKLIMQSYNLDGIEVENGSVKDRTTIVDALKTDYADFVGTGGEQGVPPVKPPSGAGNAPLTLDDVRKMTPEQINANWDTVKGILNK